MTEASARRMRPHVPRGAHRFFTYTTRISLQSPLGRHQGRGRAYELPDGTTGIELLHGDRMWARTGAAIGVIFDDGTGAVPYRLDNADPDHFTLWFSTFPTRSDSEAAAAGAKLYDPVRYYHLLIKWDSEEDGLPV